MVTILSATPPLSPEQILGMALAFIDAMGFRPVIQVVMFVMVAGIVWRIFVAGRNAQ